MKNQTSKSAYQDELNPELYIERQRNIRRRKIEEVACGAFLLFLLAVTFTVVQVAYGIW